MYLIWVGTFNAAVKILGLTKCGEFLDCQRKCYPLEDSAIWT